MSDIQQTFNAQQTFCLICCQQAAKEREKNHPVNPAITWTYALIGAGIPVTFPVCAIHLVPDSGLIAASAAAFGN